MNVSIGFIGFGNMAQAMAKGFAASGEGIRMYACAKHWEPLCVRAKEHGVIACRKAAEVVAASDIVILAVKPYMIESVCQPLREALQRVIVVSVAAGWSFADYEKILLPHTAHLSIIPNTPVAVRAGISIMETTHSLTAEQFALVQACLQVLGSVESVDGSLLAAASALAGCGPAFAAMFIEALGDAGVMHGLPRAQAYRLAAQMLAGTGALQLQSKAHPGMMKDAVCSPRGTTIRGVAKLEEAGFRHALIQAVTATMKA